MTNNAKTQNYKNIVTCLSCKDVPYMAAHDRKVMSWELEAIFSDGQFAIVQITAYYNKENTSLLQSPPKRRILLKLTLIIRRIAVY